MEEYLNVNPLALEWEYDVKVRQINGDVVTMGSGAYVMTLSHIEGIITISSWYPRFRHCGGLQTDDCMNRKSCIDKPCSAKYRLDPNMFDIDEYNRNHKKSSEDCP